MRISSQSPHYPSAASRRPPWPVVVVVLLAVLALAGISWPALSGPAADFRLNRAIHRAAGSFTPEALERITSLGLHAVRVRSFAGLESCPNLQRLYIHPDSVEPWRTWADAQLPEADPLKPDSRPTLPLLPKLTQVTVGAPGK